VTTGSPGEESPRETPQAVFVSDPSAEAERMAQALRAAGYAVVDVPLSMLIARVAVQRPRVILLDADAEGALAAVARLRDLPDAEGIDVVFVGKLGEALSGPEDAMSHEGSGFFARPVDVPALVRKIDTLTGGSSRKQPAVRDSAPPQPSQQGSGRPAALPPPSMRAESEPPRRLSERPPPGPRPRSQPPSLADAGYHPSPPSIEPGKRALGVQTPLSTELEQLLAEAEHRVGAQMREETVPPTPEEEIEAVLPAEILSSLDEPIDEEDEDDLDVGRGGGAHETRPPPGRGITSSGRAHEANDAGDAQAAKTHGGPQGSATTGTRGGSNVVDTGHRVDTANRADTGSRVETGNRPDTSSQRESAGIPSTRALGPLAAQERQDHPTGGGQGGPPTEHFPSGATYAANLGSWGPPSQAAVPAGSTLGSGVLDALASGLHELSGAAFPPPPPVPSLSPAAIAAQARSQKAESVPPPPPAGGSLLPIPSVIGPNEAPLVLARAIAQRSTGALCVESDEGVRRVVLREGDLVTAASGVENESLLAFLGGRGELPREIVQQLAGKVPPFGRHAGAALVAHGHLRQDQLWPVLRAHAEWILGRVALVTRGTALIESDPPGRLKGEPSVFGGSTGAEVLIEVIRRTIAPDEAILRLGGAASRVGEGPNHSLLSECALDAAERDLLARMQGAALGDLAQASAQADFASMIYGLSLLGVFDVIRAVAPARPPTGDGDGHAIVDALDEDAVRARVRARLALVDEADYFALLGLTPEATGYEVRRAFLELRRTFDPQRVLTPQIADLADDVRKIVVVLEEAYEILRDNARRERYRRAIGATPEA